MKLSRDALFLIVLFGLLVAVLSIFTSRTPKIDSDISTTYSVGPRGVKAFYTLLGERLGYNVQRLYTPYNEMPADAKVLVVIQPLSATPIAPAEQSALQSWVSGGGVAIFITDSPQRRVPAIFARSRSLGRGAIYVFDSRKVITNEGMKDYRNAMRIISLISSHASPNSSTKQGGLILFDEYHHGLGRSKTAMLLIHVPFQIKLGVVVIAFALISFGYSKARRFGAVRSLPESQNLRPEFEFVESVARLYQRAGRPELAASILTTSMRQRLCRKLGLPADAPQTTIIQLVESHYTPQIASDIARLLDYEHAGRKISVSTLLSVAQQIRALEDSLYG